MIYPTIEIDEQALRGIQRQLAGIEHQAPKAISRALNRSLTAMKTSVSKEVRTDYNIAAKTIKDSLITSKATTSKLKASVRSRSKALGLEKFKVSPKTVQPKRKKQIKISVKKTTLMKYLALL